MSMAESNKQEVWLRGPLPEISNLLQPVAHSLLQAREELNELIKDFPDEMLWERPGGVASAGFHLQHMAGVIDRLFTYARGAMLSPAQLQSLSAEGTASNQTTIGLAEKFNKQVNFALEQLIISEKNELTAVRAVGRSKIPSTVIGLYIHAAEHTMRHLGQLLVTVRILKAGS